MKGFIAFVLVVAFIGAFGKWILMAIVIAMAVKAAPQAWREHQSERAAEGHRLREMIARAELQYQWVLASDPSGTYGRYIPTELAR